MAFTDRRGDGHRIAKIVAVSAIHGMVIYGLVTGLAVNMVRPVDWVLPTDNHEADPPPPPPPPPEATPTDKPQVIEFTPHAPLPVPGPLPIRNIPANPDPHVDRLIELPTPLPSPLPSASPKQATPRNNPGLWVTTNDYPTPDIREGNEGTVSFVLSIDADGKVRNCEVVQSSGHPRLDAATCKNVSRRARFEPAADTAGERVAGTYSNTVRWVIPQD